MHEIVGAEARCMAQDKLPDAKGMAALLASPKVNRTARNLA
jgi:hypothetical protein